MTTRRTRRGFTLAELIVGAVIIALISGSVIVTLSQAIDGERRSRARQEAVGRANAAADRIARDARALVRTGDLFYARCSVTSGGDGPTATDELLMVVTTTRATPNAVGGATGRARTGASAEVQYRVLPDRRTEGVPGGERSPASVLWRRVDEMPDEFVDAGGVVFPVVEGVRGLDIRAHDGTAWTDTWDSDLQGYPHALRIEVSATSDDGRYTERAVRVVPIDRVPLPFVSVLVQGQGDGAGDGR